MLGKLIKHEWKDTSKMMLIFLSVILLAGVMGYFSGTNIVTKDIVEGEIEESMIPGLVMREMVIGVGLVASIIAIAGVGYAAWIFLGIHFYKTMYTDEGYLTNTLPVTKHQLLVSKILVSSIWGGLVNLVMIFAIFAMCIGVVQMSAGLSGTSLIEVYEEIADAFVSVNEYVDISWGWFWGSIVVVILLAPIFLACMIVAGVTIGQLSRKYKMLMGVLSVVGLKFLVQIITMFIQVPIGVSMDAYISAESNNIIVYYSLMYSLNAVLQIIFSLIFYMLSYQILNRKLNLE